MNIGGLSSTCMPDAQYYRIMVHSTRRPSTGKCTKKHPSQDEMMESAKVSAQMSLLPNKARETRKTDFPYHSRTI